MTKKQLIKWIEGKQSAALAQIDDQYQKALTDHKAVLYIELGIADLAAEIKPLLDKADALLSAWSERHAERVTTTSEYYNSLRQRLYPFISSENALYESIIAHEFRDSTPERKQLENRKSEMSREVKANYGNVIRNLEALANAKLGLEYLKELGFDVSEVVAMDEKPVITALAVPVDTRFLFLAKEGA